MQIILKIQSINVKYSFVIIIFIVLKMLWKLFVVVVI